MATAARAYPRRLLMKALPRYSSIASRCTYQDSEPSFPTMCSSTADMIAGLRLKEFPKSVSTTWDLSHAMPRPAGKIRGANSVHY